MRFDGRCVLVTGATSGIGAATAKAFAAEGASVVISGRNAERAAGVIAEAGETPAAIVFIAADLRDESAYETLIADATDRLGRLDVLVNNAGILHRAGSLETTPEQWAEAMSVNVNAPFFLSRAAARGMKAQGGGAIVNVSSELGLTRTRAPRPTAPPRARWCSSPAPWPSISPPRRSASIACARAAR